MIYFDYIIIGAGASGLMLADAMGRDSHFAKRSILLIDKEAKRSNDRTWCFWEKGPGTFDAIVSKTWSTIYFGGQQFSKIIDIQPYHYKMIRGVDFYEHYLNRLAKYPNIEFRQEKITGVEDKDNEVLVSSNANQYSAKKVFNSIFNYNMTAQQTKYPVLQQHFLGWTIQTTDPIFNPSQVTYMDFSIPQKGNTRFMYVLPFSKTKALVEYTLFSKEVLEKSEYKEAIVDYLQNQLGCQQYNIIETEQGSIPMTCYDFRDHHTKNIRYIGTAGGWAKPSTGYTFMSSAKKVPTLVEYIKTGAPLNKLSYRNRFWYYDLLLLDVLAKNNAEGHLIFETLFKNRDIHLIFKFLDEQTILPEELYYIAGCSKTPFLQALIKRLF